MKRLRALIEELRGAYPTDSFFHDFESSCLVDPIKRKHYRSYNDALTKLDDESWLILKKKAVEQFGNERKGQTKQGFFNQLNEAFAYRYLLNKRYTQVLFVAESTRKMPDLSYSDHGIESYCEVKTIGISDEEIKRRKIDAGVQDLSVYLKLGEGFFKKVEEDIARARDQIRSAGPNGLVFILVRFDDIALDHYQRYRKQLFDYSRSRKLTDVVIKVGHRGNRTIKI